MTVASNKYFLSILGYYRIRSITRNCFYVLRPNVIFCDDNVRFSFDFGPTLLRTVVNRYIIVNFVVFSYFNEFIVTCCKCTKTAFESYWFIVCQVNFALKGVTFLLYGSPSTCVFLFLVSILMIACWFLFSFRKHSYSFSKTKTFSYTFSSLFTSSLHFCLLSKNGIHHKELTMHFFLLWCWLFLLKKLLVIPFQSKFWMLSLSFNKLFEVKWPVCSFYCNQLSVCISVIYMPILEV